MAILENLKRGVCIAGILPNALVTVIDVDWFSSSALLMTYKDNAGRLDSRLLYRHDEAALSVEAAGQSWALDADGKLLRLVSEAYRIHLAYLFDPVLAVHTSLVDPLPHQITAVYEEMLTRQPLRFLLADDPGAGKTIMAGLLIKELLIRGDLHRCLIVCPGSLVEQWQDELQKKFHLAFDILTNDGLNAARTGNWFFEHPLAICRLDKLSRSEDVQAKLEQVDFDLVVCDEAHKMSATFFGGEVKYTKRYHLGQLLSRQSRHFLLMTATPHNGKEADFQLFLALLDGDRFEGKFRDGVHAMNASDMMRRLVKEQLLTFEGRPLFPERRAYTATYTLSEAEANLYQRVTDYVREEFNRADALNSEGRKSTVGFALTSLQRRLASSPEAIFQSIRRRRERLESRLREERLQRRVGQMRLREAEGFISLSAEELEELDDAPGNEQEEVQELILDQATAAQTIVELESELETLQSLETLAQQVRRSGRDCKWENLSELLQSNAEMLDAHGHLRKLLIFTEHRDTLNYLCERIRSLLGRDEAVVVIHGGMGREERRKSQEGFTHDKEVSVLIATDAAGEGINLQRAHLMVNYDLPWNPNRLEQRFGRIHRIGQTEVCHCWNLVASETREGEVYLRLLEKLSEEREALQDRVFDVLGSVTFEDRPLRELLIEAVRYGDQPEVRARLTQVVDRAMNRARLLELLQERALATDSMSADRVYKIREVMERAEARRLQPHYVAAFFREAFQHLGGSIHEREAGRFEVTHVPSVIRNRDRALGVGEPVLSRYERVAFDKAKLNVPGKPLAAFLCPGHPLLDATIDLILERYRDLMKRGAVLVDASDPGEDVRALFYLEHVIQDARTNANGSRREVSRRLQFVEVSSQGAAHTAGYAPYLDYRPLTESDRSLLEPTFADTWDMNAVQRQVLGYAIAELVPAHMEEIKSRREELVTKTAAAVQERLTKEITYWDHRAAQIRLQELAGKTPRLNSAKAQQRADDLTGRLHKRQSELALERQVAPQPPVVVGSALIVPIGLLAKLQGEAESDPGLFARETRRVELLAMQAVMDAERALGFDPHDVSAAKCGWDIESRISRTGRLRFLEVKGRVAGAETVTITQNEIRAGLNKPDDFILAIVQIQGEAALTPHYIRQAFQREPDFGVTSVNYNLSDLLSRATPPC